MSAIHYVAKLDHVHEVTLAGIADLGYWTRALEPEGLLPRATGGHAEILIVGADARFRGMRFQELSVSVVIAPQSAHDHLSRAFLVEAFNSRRFFAWSERMFFSTPYSRADVAVRLDPPNLRLARGGRGLFQARMDGAGDWDLAPRDFDGTVFVPSRRRRRFFFAKLLGETRIRAFDPGDQCEYDPAGAPVLQQLADSGFTPREWIVRADAHHAKSRTYRQAWRAEER